MSFNIPGYFLDKKTNKLFKITPHGPFSLSELKKRVKREEEEEAAKKAIRKPSSCHNKITQKCIPTNINQLLKKRAGFGSPRTPVSDAFSLHCLFWQLKTREKAKLNDPILQYNNMLVEVTDDNDLHGEMFINSRLGLQHYGYEIEPQFHMWRANCWNYGLYNIQSMHLHSKLIESGATKRRILSGTIGGVLWSRSFEVLPPLIHEEMQQMFIDQESNTIKTNNGILPPPSYSYSNHSSFEVMPSFERSQDLFWDFSVNKTSDIIVIGGDKKVYLLNNYNLSSSRKVKSSVFSTYIPKHRSDICWTGSRNGVINLMDWRENQLSPNFRFTQSSSVLKIQSFDDTKTGFELLTVGMDGSINVWDTRKPKKNISSFTNNKKGGYSSSFKDNFTSPEPILTLKGHVNESSRSLGFDVDQENNLVMAAGSDGVVRIWSYSSTYNDCKPIWSSKKFASPVPACKFKTNTTKYPRFQEGWNSILDKSQISIRQCPGVLLFGTTENNTDNAAIEWLTPFK